MAEIVVKLVNGELAGKTAQSIAKEVNDAAKALKKAEVGTKAWVDANKKLEDVKNLQADLKKQTEGLASASDGLKNAWNKLPGAQYFNQIGDSFGLMKKGVGGLIGNFGILKTAIAATGIGLLVLVVGSLVLAFSKFAPLVDKVEQAMSGLGQVVDVIVNRLINVGKAMWDIINGDFSGGIDKISHSFDGMGAAMKEAYTAGVELKKLQQDLEDAARGLEVANTRAEKQIEKLIIQSKNKSLSDKEQIELLKQARQIANENFKANDQQKQKEFDTLITEAKLKSKLSEDEILQLVAGTLAQETEYEKRGTIEDDLLDKIKDAQIERINASGQTSKQLEKIQNAEDSRLEKQKAAREKDLADKARENEQFLKDQEKFNEEQHKIQENEDKFQENRRLANLEKEKAHIKAGMLAALDSINKQVAASDEGQKDKAKIAESEAAIQSESLAVFNEGTNSIISLLGATTEARKKNALAIKTLEMGQVIVNGITEVSQIAKTFAALGPIGQVLAAFRIAFSIARTAAGVKRIQSQKFEKGGIPSGVLRGPSHAGGGIPLVAEGEEIILTKGVYRDPRLRSMASQLNVAGGGRSFAAGGPVNPLDSSRGPVSSGAAATLDMSSIENLLRQNIEATNARFDRLKVENVATETEGVLKTINKIKADADV